MATALRYEVGRGGAGFGETIRAVPLSPEEVGRRIVAARSEMKPKAWSQFDLALAMQVAPSTIYRWEKGRLPSMAELVRLAEVLEQPVDYLTEPPEQRAALSTLTLELAELQRLLQELSAQIEASREAGFEALASNDVRLSRIEERLGLGAPGDSTGQSEAPQ